MDDQVSPDAARMERLDALGKTIAEKRDEAKEARKNSGIEKVWMACEEAYLGIDDANRSEWSDHRWAKPSSMEGPVTRETAGETDKNKSTAYVRLTSRYVDAGAAKVSEILLPIDDKPFSFDPTPVPELIEARDLLKKIMQNGGEMPSPPAQPQAMAAAVQGAMQEQPGDPVAAAKAAVDRAMASAKKAEKRVFDWLVESGFPAEMRKAIFDAARIGTGVIKAPFAEVRTEQAVVRNGDAVAMEIKEKTVPATRWIDPWNLFPDASCGEDIHSGDHIFERDFMSPRRLKKLKKNPLYLADRIEKVIKEGPDKCLSDEDGSNPNQPKDPKLKNRRFEVWYYYGMLSREDMLAVMEQVKSQSPDNPMAIPEGAEEMFAIVTLVNDTVIRAVLHPLDSGHFPYRVFTWSRRAGSWTGVGVGEQIFVPQRMCNAATRAMMNSAGRSAGVQIVIDQSVLVPGDGSWNITPDKIWYKAPDATMEDVNKSFKFIEIPDRQQMLMNIIEYAFRLAEESSNIPLISQGQSGPTTPDTYGAAQLQNNNANQLLRNVAATCDDNVTEPMIRDFYEWLLLDPDVPDDEKGDFQINAHGSSALVERAIQDQTIQNLVVPSKDAAYGLKPKLVMAEYLKSKRIDPRSLSYTDEEMAEMAKAPPPLPPQVQAAMVRAKVQMATAQLENETNQIKIKRDIDRDTIYVRAEADRTRAEFMSRREELAARRELAFIEYANRNKTTLDEIKGRLADRAMTLRVQKELAAASNAAHPAPQVARPAVEPPGRAQPGEAFQR